MLFTQRREQQGSSGWGGRRRGKRNSSAPHIGTLRRVVTRNAILQRRLSFGGHDFVTIMTRILKGVVHADVELSAHSVFKYLGVSYHCGSRIQEVNVFHFRAQRSVCGIPL